MDDTPLKPVSQVTMQVLNGLIESQTKLRDAAEKRWSFARESLFNLARLVAADWLEERKHKKGGLECWLSCPQNSYPPRWNAGEYCQDKRYDIRRHRSAFTC